MNNFDITCETFSGRLKGNIACLQLHRHFLLRTENLNARDQVLDFLDRVSASKSVRILVFAGAPDAKGRDEFLSFFKKFHDQGMDIALIYRMFNFIDQLVLKLAELKKFTIYVNSGNVLASFMNFGFACDYRILADNAIIQNPNIILGLSAKGGGAYFLPRLVGLKQAWDVILSDKDISASEAVDMGLVQEITPFEELEKTAFSRAEEYAENSFGTLSTVRRLMHFSNRDLQQYLEYETTLLLDIVKTPEFWEKVNQI